VTDWAQTVLTDGGYAVLAALILLENLLPPIPSELLLPLAGSRVATGDMAYFPAVLAATAGSVIGAMLLYALGRFGGRPLLLRYGRILRLDDRRLDRADDWFDRHGPKIVLFGRLVPGVRSVVSIPAGLSEMPVWRFVTLTALGSTVWNAMLIGGGWALGARWRELTHAVESIDVWAYAAVVAAIVGVYAVHRARRLARATD
jgi:membrane protein DedA with SNARE-associated domain